MKVGSSVKKRGKGYLVRRRTSKRAKGGPKLYFVSKQNRKFNQRQG